MKNENGMTLISLVVTVVVMAILTFTVTFSGMSTLEYGRMKAFVSNMQMIQEKVNLFCDKAEAYRENGDIKQYIKDVIEANGENLNYPDEVEGLNYNSEPIVILVSKMGELNFNAYFRYFNSDDLKRVFGLSNIDREVLINFYTREVYDLKGVKYKGIKYYTQYDLPGGDNLIQDNEYYYTPNRDFSCIKDVQKFIVPEDGEYILEVWGAQGGGTFKSDVTLKNQGAYCKATKKLKAGDTLYVAVGGQGTAAKQTAAITDVWPGGYNGGGDGIYLASGGGGATYISLNSNNVPESISKAWDDLLLIAAGGSGASGSSIFSEGLYGRGSSSTGTMKAYLQGGDGSVKQYSASSRIFCVSGSGGGYKGGYMSLRVDSATFATTSPVYSNSYIKNKTDSDICYAGNVEFLSPTGEKEIGHNGDGYARITKEGEAVESNYNIDEARDTELRPFKE